MAEWKYLSLIIFSALGMCIILTLFFRPFKLVRKIAVCGLIGFLSLAVLNIFLRIWGMHVVINPFTVLMAGILKLPGIILLVICDYLFV
ncbi:MAG: pro-sigmaK processing inhibitor BofA family protein [Clostridiales bacterium]|nr:pro-sigmaK processing inhibitor BofA family protein [Clostridiales bacterium]MCF8021529.1 pro-sigmaK processing inhibitor BofA family protein [Clostridiales bacterium]